MQTNIHPAARTMLDEAFMAVKAKTAADISKLTDRLSAAIVKAREFKNVWSGPMTPDDQLKMFGVYLQLQVDPLFVTVRKTDGVIDVQVVRPATLDYRHFSVREIVTMMELEAEAEGHRAVMQSEKTTELSDQYLDDSARLFDFEWKAEDPVAYAKWQEHCAAQRQKLDEIQQRNEYHYRAWKRCQRDLEEHRELVPSGIPVMAPLGP